jgi:RNA polymerase sigma factor (sigma-70 family)
MADAADLGAFLKRLRRSFENDPAVAALDGELLERFLSSNDAGAFTALLRRHGPMVLGLCRRTLGDTPAAEDAFQTTFLLLVRKAASVLRRGSVAAWLYTVATRAASRMRSAGRQQPQGALPDEVPDSEPDAAAQAQRRELCRLVEEEVGRLPGDYRAAVIACYFQGLSCRAAAHHLGCPVGTVAARLSRARDRLRQRLEQRGLAVPGVVLSTLLGALSPASAEVPMPLVQAIGKAVIGLRTAAGGATALWSSPGKGAWRMCLGRKSVLLAASLMVGVGVTMALLPGLPQEQAVRAGPAPPDRSQIADLLERLQSDDVEVYLAARTRLLGLGQRCRAPLEELQKRLAERGDRRRLLRVRNLLWMLGQEETLRDIETGMARLARLRAARGPRKAATTILLLNRNFCERFGNWRLSDNYAGMCYYSFPKGQHGYEGQVSLEYANPGDQFLVQMYGGQESGLQDLGPVDFDTVKAVPKDVKGKGRSGYEVTVGHVYVEHQIESKDEDLGGFKFEVLDLLPDRWVILAWERIPLEKDEKARR